MIALNDAQQVDYDQSREFNNLSARSLHPLKRPNELINYIYYVARTVASGTIINSKSELYNCNLRAAVWNRATRDRRSTMSTETHSRESQVALFTRSQQDICNRYRTSGRCWVMFDRPRKRIVFSHTDLTLNPTSWRIIFFFFSKCQ